jgi:hypothetical protein
MLKKVLIALVLLAPVVAMVGCHAGVEGDSGKGVHVDVDKK